jgi:hypothetical protein
LLCETANRSGELIWGDAIEQQCFLRLFDGLLEMLDDPEMGRPLGPPPKSRLRSR